MLAPFVALLLTASPALEEARGHLKAGRVDEVYFALDKKSLPEAEHPEAAQVLTDAGRKALEKKDAVMALQLAKMAGKLKADFGPSLELASRASRALEQFSDAESFADAWLKADPSPEAGVWRAELAIDAGDWSKALGHLDAVKGNTAVAAKAKTLRDRAQKEQSSKQTGLSTLKQLERELARAQAERKAEPSPARVAQAETRSQDIVLYSTSTCEYCRKARAWFQKKGVAFTEKDVEKDLDAQRELVEKAARSGLQVTGVPVIDVRGTLVLGFDPRQLDKLL